MVERALGLRAESPECGFPTESGGAKRRADQPAGLCHVGESRGQRVAAEFLLFRQPKREFLPSLVWIRRHGDRKSTRLNSSHLVISYAVFCLKKKEARQCYR